MQDDLFSLTRGVNVQRGQWPSEQLADLLMGKVAWDKAPDAIQSWASFYIHDAAVQVLNIKEGGREARLAALGKIPPAIRQRVEDEAKRVWAYWKR